jgi:hypothetical protein
MAHALILENIITHDVKYIVPEHVWLIVGLKFYVEFRNSLKAVKLSWNHHVVLYALHSYFALEVDSYADF